MKRILLVMVVTGLAAVMPLSAADWAPASGGDVPRRAFQAGNEADGTPLYIIRAPYEGGICLGKLNPKHETGYLSWGGREIPVRNYEVYTGTGRWAPASGGDCPPGAVRGGSEANGAPLFIARGRWEGSLTPGKLNPDHRTAYIPYAGKEIGLRDYQVLVADGGGGRAWVRASGGDVPPGAFRAGREADGSPLYVIRAPYQGGLCPGKLSTATGRAYIPFGGREIGVDSYEVYTGTGRWVRARDGYAPPGAVRGGKEADGSSLYLARGRWEGSLTPGKLSERNRTAYIPYGGKEIQLPEYEVLVEDEP